jgi:hypothetical protein
VPAVVADPVVITVVVNDAILPVAMFPDTILALADTVRYENVAALAFELFVTLKLFAATFPVTVTAPNVVVPPLAVEVNVAHADATAPSLGQTFSACALVSYQSWPRSGFAGGVVAEKFSKV